MFSPFNKSSNVLLGISCMHCVDICYHVFLGVCVYEDREAGRFTWRSQNHAFLYGDNFQSCIMLALPGTAMMCSLNSA
jgi:hypothetical protein